MSSDFWPSGTRVRIRKDIDRRIHKWAKSTHYNRKDVIVRHYGRSMGDDLVVFRDETIEDGGTGFHVSARKEYWEKVHAKNKVGGKLL